MNTSQNFLVIKFLEKAKFNRLKTIILTSSAKDIEVLIRNELLRNKYTLADKSSDEIYKKGINMLREELKSKDFIIKYLLQTIKEIKSKSVSVQSIPSCMSNSEVNLVPANNSVAIEDVYNNNDEIADTNDKILIPGKKKQMIMIYSKNLRKTNLKK